MIKVISAIEEERIKMLNSSIAKWSDFKSDWYKKLLKEVDHKCTPHRKQWEYLSFLQAIKERNLIGPGKRGLVFGVGSEWTVSYLASKGCEIVATDMRMDNSKSKHWKDSNQLCLDDQQLFYPSLVNKTDFDRLVSFRNVDMNNIPDDLIGFDFCWSLCAFEHLGSAQHGYNFIMNSINCLNPGGVAFHTTEFDLNPECTLYETQDNVFYRQPEIEYLVNIIEEKGNYVEPRDYTLGNSLEDYPTKEPTEDRHITLFSGINHLVSSMRLIIQKNKE